MSVASVLKKVGAVVGAVAAGADALKNNPYKNGYPKETDLEQLAQIQVEAEEKRKKSLLLYGGGALAAVAVFLAIRKR